MAALIAILGGALVLVWWWRNVMKRNPSDPWERRRSRFQSRRRHTDSEQNEPNPDFDFTGEDRMVDH